MDRWIDIIKGKLVGWELSIGGHVPLTEKEKELIFRKIWVYFSKGDHVESQVPRGILYVCVCEAGGFIHVIHIVLRS